MSLHSQRTILAGTDEGLHLFNGEGAARVDDLAGRVATPGDDVQDDGSLTGAEGERQ